jgi:hypothetical protein
MVFDWDAANVERRPTWHYSENCESTGMTDGDRRQRRKHERRRLCLGETRRGRLLTFVVIERKGKVRFVTAYPMHALQRRVF